jgi:hypothetical protein
MARAVASAMPVRGRIDMGCSLAARDIRGGYLSDK